MDQPEKKNEENGNKLIKRREALRRMAISLAAIGGGIGLGTKCGLDPFDLPEPPDPYSSYYSYSSYSSYHSYYSYYYNYYSID
jgi:hypothetical protein